MSKNGARLGWFAALVIASAFMWTSPHPLIGAQNPTLLVSAQLPFDFEPVRMALDPGGNAYVAGAVHDSGCVMKLTKAGAVAYTTCLS